LHPRYERAFFPNACRFFCDDDAEQAKFKNAFGNQQFLSAQI